jgi:hypothetical protein
MKKNTIGSLVGYTVYYGYANGMCYSGELELEVFKRKTRYIIKRAIPIQFPDHKDIATVYIDENKIDKIVWPNIYLKQEKNMTTKELGEFILENIDYSNEVSYVINQAIVDESIETPF